MSKDLNYYQRRSADEEAAAETAPDSRAKAVHRELARRYRERCTVIGSESAESEVTQTMEAKLAPTIP